jgi:hypothetical protein
MQHCVQSFAETIEVLIEGERVQNVLDLQDEEDKK